MNDDEKNLQEFNERILTLRKQLAKEEKGQKKAVDNLNKKISNKKKVNINTDNKEYVKYDSKKLAYLNCINSNFDSLEKDKELNREKLQQLVNKRYDDPNKYKKETEAEFNARDEEDIEYIFNGSLEDEYNLDDYAGVDDGLYIVRGLATYYDIKKYLDKKGFLKKKFLDKIDFDFTFKNGKNHKAFINYNNVDNIETEIFLLNIVSGNFKIVPKSHEYLYKKIRDHINSEFMQAILANALLDNIHLTTYPFTINKAHTKILRYRNPLNKDHRLIKTDGRTYKKTFKQIRLREVTFQDVNIDNIEYNINDNCVKSYFRNNYGKNNVKEYLIEDEPNTIEILEFAKKVNIEVYVYNINKDLLYSHIPEETEYKILHYFIHNNHMFVFNPHVKKQESMLYNPYININQLYDKKIYVEELSEFNKLLKQYKKDYSMINYNKMNFPVKNNCNIIFDPLYKEKRKVLDDFKYNSDNIYNCIDRYIGIKDNATDVGGLRGFLNEETLKSFIGFKKIRFYKTNLLDDIRFDMVHCYGAPFYSYRLFPVPSLNDYWEKYKNEEIVDYYIYYCTFKYYDIILHPVDDITYGECLKYLLKEGNIIESIKSVLKVSNTRKINQSILPNKLLDDKSEHNHIPKKFLIHYAGFLASLTSDRTTYSIVNDNDEAYELMNKYNTSSIYSNETKLNNNIFKHTTITNKFYNGLLVNFMIKELTNLALYKLNKQFLNDNPAAILNSIHTDAIGYIIQEKPKYNEYIDSNIVGKFKVEKYSFDPKNIKFLYYDPNKKVEDNILDGVCYIKDPLEDNGFVEYNMRESDYESRKIINREVLKLNNYDSSEYKTLINNNNGFSLCANAGYGKSYLLKEDISPYLSLKKYTHIICSTVSENCEQFDNCNTLQILLHMKTNEQLIDTFKDINYLIIDEAVQIKQEHLIKLEFIKNNTNCKFIMLCDFNQCVVENYDGIPFINTYFCHKLIDFNILTIKKHKNIRYDKELDIILDKVIELKNNLIKLRQYIKKVFNNISKKDATNELTNLCYTNNYRKESKFDCSTVHKVQGKTLKDDFYIHEIDKMPFSVIYTAISRAIKKNQISIIL